MDRTIKQRNLSRQIGWVACLILAMILVIAGILPVNSAFKQATGFRELMKAGKAIRDEELFNPFICLRENTATANQSIDIENFYDGYLRLIGSCMNGTGVGADDSLAAFDNHANGLVQYAGGLSAINPQAGVQALARAGLDAQAMVAVVKNLMRQPEVDPFPVLRLAGKEANGEAEIWSDWIQGSSMLEKKAQWQAALDWLEEGLEMAPSEVRGSLLGRAGWIYQARTDAPDYQMALDYYNQALDEGGWINLSDKAVAHQHRGEMYRIIKGEYTTDQVLEEFDIALDMLPENYWVLLSIGSVYLHDLGDTEKAELYYRQALASDDQNPNAYLKLGDVYREQGDNAAAAAWYRQALERQPDWQAALDRLAALEGK